MDERIRISDADRERVTARLRDHYAEGRLTLSELDERITATLNAKTFGDLRPVTADLPEPVPEPPRSRYRPQQAPPPWRVRRRGPRLVPLLLLAGLAALLIPSVGWLFVALLKTVLVFWLIACLAGILLAGRFGRRMRRDWQTGRTHSGRPDGHPHDRHRHH